MMHSETDETAFSFNLKMEKDSQNLILIYRIIESWCSIGERSLSIRNKEEFDSEFYSHRIEQQKQRYGKCIAKNVEYVEKRIIISDQNVCCLR